MEDHVKCIPTQLLQMVGGRVDEGGSSGAQTVEEAVERHVVGQAVGSSNGTSSESQVIGGR